MTMNRSIRDLWAASLKDGSFKQGKYQLRDLDDYYDATGVLCELAVSAGVIDPPKKRTKPEAQLFFGYDYGHKTYGTQVPQPVLYWAGLTQYTAYHVALMGDRGKKFPEIAEWIEENL
jgi:hypothetical protein